MEGVQVGRGHTLVQLSGVGGICSRTPPPDIKTMRTVESPCQWTEGVLRGPLLLELGGMTKKQVLPSGIGRGVRRYSIQLNTCSSMRVTCVTRVLQMVEASRNTSRRHHTTPSRFTDTIFCSFMSRGNSSINIIAFPSMFHMLCSSRL